MGKPNMAIFLGESNCISTWLAALICHLRDIEVVFWGHGFYGNENKIKLLWRKIFYKLANKHILYERRGKQIMIKNGFNASDLYVVFNSLNYDKHKYLRKQFQLLSKSDVFPFFKNPNLPVLIYIGRLTAIKKLELLINSFIRINSTKHQLNLIIIGDGPERKNLEELGREALSVKTLYFTGPCYLEEEIGRYLFAADLCVSPGNIGLTAIHSLSYGTPICTHGNLNKQMPEAEAIIHGYNGFYFKENNIDDIIQNITNWLDKNTERELIRQRCYEIIDKYYNPNYQETVFNRLLNHEMPELLK